MMDLSGDELLPRQAAVWQTLSLSPVWRPIDRELAQFLLRLNGRLGGADEPALALCIALLSHELGEGDVCLALTWFNPHVYLDTVVMLGMLSETSMNIALPDLVDEFSVSSGTAQWMVVGYMLAIGVALPYVGFLLRWVKAKTLVMVASTDR